jgi:hypothetical protein
MRAINGLAAECIEPSVPVGNDTITLQRGLTSEEAQQRIKTSGQTRCPDTSVHPLRMSIEELWVPVSWILAAAIVLELVLAKYVEAGITDILLMFSAGSTCSRKAAPRRRLPRSSRGLRSLRSFSWLEWRLRASCGRPFVGGCELIKGQSGTDQESIGRTRFRNNHTY